MNKEKANITFGIRNCAECENNIRCEECCYNKQSREKIQQETALWITQIIKDYAKDDSLDTLCKKIENIFELDKLI